MERGGVAVARQRTGRARNENTSAYVAAMLVILFISVLLGAYSIELGLAKPGSNPRRVVLTAAEIDATLQGEPDFLAFSEALSTAFVARRVIAVRNPAGNRIKHSIDNALDCYVALRDAWQTELVGDWDPDIQGDAAYWRGAHPAVRLPGEDRLGPTELRAALRAEARAYVDEAMEIVDP